MLNTRHLHIRVREKERARWERAALQTGLTLSDWVRAVLDERALLQDRLSAVLLQNDPAGEEALAGPAVEDPPG